MIAVLVSFALFFIFTVIIGKALPCLFSIKNSFSKSYLFHFWLFSFICFLRLTDETFNLFVYNSQNRVFDALAVSLLKGDVLVPRLLSDNEWFIGFQAETVVYFGPFPAFLRMPLMFFFPELKGYSQRCSMLLAAIISGGLISLFVQQIVNQLNNVASRTKILLLHLALLSSLYCLPTYFLVGSALYFHELILWGLCGFLFALLAYERSLRNSDSEALSSRLLIIATCGAAFAMLSRLTFIFSSIPIILVLTWKHAALIKAKLPAHKLAQKLVLLTFPLLLAGTTQAWYNYARFGNVFETLPYSKFSRFSPEPAYLAPSTFDLTRVMLQLDTLFSIPEFKPWKIPIPTATIANEIAFGSPLKAPVPALAPFLAVQALLLLVGFCLALAPHKIRLADQLIALGTFLQFFIILTYIFMTSRYLADILPLLFFVGLALPFRYCLSSMQASSVLRRSVLGIVAGLSSLVLLYSILLGIYWTASINSGYMRIDQGYRDILKQRLFYIESMLK